MTTRLYAFAVYKCSLCNAVIHREKQAPLPVGTDADDLEALVNAALDDKAIITHQCSENQLGVAYLQRVGTKGRDDETP